MPDRKIERLKSVDNFESLVSYLRDELDWPIEVENADDITFEYNPEDLNINEKHAAKIKKIKQIRPLTDNQPWGIFFIEFEPKKLPIGVMRRILKALIHKKRSYDDKKPTWELHDLMFISSLGEIDERKISFAHFTDTEEGLPELRTFSWDKNDTHLHYLQKRLDLDKLRWPDDDQDIDNWQNQWSSAFRLRYREVIRTSQQLAVEMARLAAQIRDHIIEIYEYEVPNGPLHNLYNNFKKVLIHDLKIDSFADMYSQTIAYGLFSARVTHEGEFIIEDIPAMIPNTNPFLKKLFDECTNIGKVSEDNLDLDELGVTELIKTLKESNIEAVLADFGRQKKGEDPVVHFYELFLREYDPEQKVKRGVFYTPDSVVSFIVRSVDHLLKSDFNCTDGLADTSKTKVKRLRPKKKGNGFIEEDKPVSKVQILDPAVGTGTFLKHTIDVIKSRFNEKNKNLDDEELKEEWNEYVVNDLLNRLFGFELMMAPYAVCHLKLGLELSETGYTFESDKRLGVYLTNTIEGKHEGAGTLDAYLNWLAEEGHKANIIKGKNPINVIIGNPPYSNFGKLNKSKWILSLLEDYKKGLNERKINIDDDYIKFLRFMSWRIEKTGMGIIGVITNNSYIDGITHRVMRKHFLEIFDKIYIMNLHGNVNKGEPDKNVFDIRVGVSIALFIKYEKPLPEKEKKVFYYSTIDNNIISREDKYRFLNKNCVNTINWVELKPKESFFWFIEKDTENIEEYNKGWSLSDIFETMSVGIGTKVDKISIDFEKDKLKQRIKDILYNRYSKEELIKRYDLSSRTTWEYERALKANFDDNKFVEYDYRPFDFRYIFYDENFLSRARTEVMSNFYNKENIGLETTRTEKICCFISNKISDEHFGGPKSYKMPLYIFDKDKKKVNFSNKFNNFIDNLYDFKPNPEEILGYIYAVLHSNKYLERYNEYLKTDFPKIIFTTDSKLFLELSSLGSNLISLHLMKSDKINNFITTFEGKGNNAVGSIGKNNYRENKLFINETQYFDGINEEIMSFSIGGYTISEKWLKDRKGRKLSKAEIEQYQKIIVIISETIKIKNKIDVTIEKNGGLPFN